MSEGIIGGFLVSIVCAVIGYVLGQVSGYKRGHDDGWNLARRLHGAEETKRKMSRLTGHQHIWIPLKGNQHQCEACKVVIDVTEAAAIQGNYTQSQRWDMAAERAMRRAGRIP